MISIANPNRENLNSILSTDFIYYSCISKEVTPHPLCISPSDLFHDDIQHQVKEKVIPLALIDLKELNASYNIKIPLLYHEMVSKRWMVSNLNAQGKIQECFMLDSDLQRIDFKDVKADDFFQDSYESTMEDMTSSIEGDYLCIGKETPYEPLLKEDIENNKLYGEWVYENLMEVRLDSSKTTEPYHWGPMIEEVQRGLEVPVDVATHTEYVYVGQYAAADLFGICDFCYYVFYNKETNSVAQLMKMT